MSQNIQDKEEEEEMTEGESHQFQELISAARFVHVIFINSKYFYSPSKKIIAQSNVQETKAILIFIYIIHYKKI